MGFNISIIFTQIVIYNPLILIIFRDRILLTNNVSYFRSWNGDYAASLSGSSPATTPGPGYPPSPWDTVGREMIPDFPPVSRNTQMEDPVEYKPQVDQL